MPVDEHLYTKAVVRRLSLPEDRRVLAVSDVHGNVEFLRGLLAKARFTPDDILFVVGDILEKGTRSLETLRYLMELSRTHTVYALRGNCDQITLDFMAHAGWPDELLWKVLCSWEGRSFLLQMADEGGLVLHGKEDFPALRELVRTRFAAELDFLASTPVVVETERYILVHGGVPREDRLDELEAHSVMKNDDFLGQGHHFRKWVVVGHWPVTLYHRHVPMARPLICREQHVVSIDGGNVLKADGQLNALILPPDPGEGESFSYVAYDGLPVAVALDDQQPSTDSLNIRWSDSEVAVVERGEELSRCRHVSTGREMWILNEYLFQRSDGSIHCEDSTDYRLPVTAGDRLAVVRRTSRATLAKKDGVTGWYFGRLTDPVQ